MSTCRGKVWTFLLFRKRVWVGLASSLLRRASVRLLPVACTARFLGISRPLAWSSAVAIFYVLALYSCSSSRNPHGNLRTDSRPAIKRRHPEPMVALCAELLVLPAAVRGRSSVPPASGCSSLMLKQRGLERGFVLPVLPVHSEARGVAMARVWRGMLEPRVGRATDRQGAGGTAFSHTLAHPHTHTTNLTSSPVRPFTLPLTSPSSPPLRSFPLAPPITGYYVHVITHPFCPATLRAVMPGHTLASCCSAFVRRGCGTTGTPALRIPVYLSRAPFSFPGNCGATEGSI